MEIENKKMKTEQTMIKFIFGNDLKYELPIRALDISSVLKEMLEDDDGNDESSNIVQFDINPLVKQEYVSKVMKFCELYYLHPFPQPKPPLSGRMFQDLFEGVDYFQVYDELFTLDLFQTKDFLEAANWLSVPILVVMLSAKVATLIKDKSRDEMINLLGLKYPIKYTMKEVIEQHPYLLKS